MSENSGWVERSIIQWEFDFGHSALVLFSSYPVTDKFSALFWPRYEPSTEITAATIPEAQALALAWAREQLRQAYVAAGGKTE